MLVQRNYVTSSGLCLLCCPTFYIRVSVNLPVRAVHTSVWHFGYLFVATLAYIVLQCLCLWSQHCSASKGREEAVLGMWSSLMARAAKQPPQWTNEVFFAVQLLWDCGQPSQWLPNGVTSITASVPGCQFTQVPLWVNGLEACPTSKE